MCKNGIFSKLRYWILAIVVMATFGIFIQPILAWTEPTQAPPNGGVGAPINTSNVGQYKLGNLILNTQGIWANGLIVANGNVGIGTTNPTAKLHLLSTTGSPNLKIESTNTGPTGRRPEITFSQLGYDQWGIINEMSGFRIQDWTTAGGAWTMLSSNTGSKNLSLATNGGNVGIGTVGTGSKLTATGVIESTVGGFKFPDGSIQDSAASGGVPSGAVMSYAASSAPTGWLICDGSAVSRSTYAALFAAIGTTYGSGNGSTTFNVPNMKGNVAVGYDSGQGEFNALGKTGGEKNHTLTIAEMPSHTHIQNSHTHPTNADRWYGNRWAKEWASSGPGIDVTIGDADASISSVTATNQYEGGGGAHNNLQPYITLQYIIKT